MSYEFIKLVTSPADNGIAYQTIKPEPGDLPK